jgi:hypothetical protein
MRLKSLVHHNQSIAQRILYYTSYNKKTISCDQHKWGTLCCATAASVLECSEANRTTPFVSLNLRFS